MGAAKTIGGQGNLWTRPLLPAPAEMQAALDTMARCITGLVQASEARMASLRREMRRDLHIVESEEMRLAEEPTTQPASAPSVAPQASAWCPEED